MFAHKALKIPGAKSQFGSSMIEVLVTVLIVSVGLLGIVALFARSQQMGDEAYQRFQALHIAHQLAETISTNRSVAGLAVLPAVNPGGYVTGTVDDGTAAPAGTADFVTTGPAGLLEFHEALLGVQKTTAGANNQTLVAALGCVESVGAGTVADPTRYRVSVVWQGRQASANPQLFTTSDPGQLYPLLCGRTEYGLGNEALRRIVSLEVQVF